MAYETHTWSNGETITADKLNNILPYKVEKVEINETFTATDDNGHYTASLQYRGKVDADFINVTFDDEEDPYSIPKRSVSGSTAVIYGSEDFSYYPCMIANFPSEENPDEYQTMIAVATSGEHTIKISFYRIESTDDFITAVNTLTMPKEPFLIKFESAKVDGTATLKCNRTYDEINQALLSGLSVLATQNADNGRCLCTNNITQCLPSGSGNLQPYYKADFSYLDVDGDNVTLYYDYYKIPYARVLPIEHITATKKLAIVSEEPTD